ncbi:MAG: histidine phosphatase family protein [Streptosporangiaceae bacterium]
MTRFLYVVRHGQAEPHDGPLSAAGAEQARLTGKRLGGVPFSGIYHPAGFPAGLIIFNDASHLPPALRWTGFPAGLRPASG